MVTAEEKAAKALKQKEAKLSKAFAEQPEDINIFEPEKEGDFILGKIVDYGISKEFSTPFLILVNKDGDEITVFVKMGIIPKFQRKKWITAEDKWNEKTVDSNIGSLIAVQYIGLAVSEKSKREFQKYKVLFPADLEKEGVTEL